MNTHPGRASVGMGTLPALTRQAQQQRDVCWVSRVMMTGWLASRARPPHTDQTPRNQGPDLRCH